MNFKLYLVAFFVGLGLTSIAKRPNIVVIMSDDQDWRHMGFMGGDVHTPNLDRMVDDGLWLTDYNVTSTVCSPSRYSFLTGRYAGRCEGESFMQLHPEGSQTQVENVCELEEDQWNLAKVLQQNGYKTGFVGKSHLVKHDWLHRHKWKENGFKEYAQDADPKDPAVTAAMQFNHQKWCDEHKKHGFDYVDGVYAANLRELFNDSSNVHNLDWSVNKAFEFLDTYQDEPFFLYFSTTLQHGPDPWDNQYSLDADPRITGEGYLKEPLNVLPSREDVKKRNAAAGKTEDKGCFLWLDDGVGAIMKKLEELGLEEDTLVIFSPDHGYYRFCKSTLHDYGMRVPMLMKWPGKIEAGRKYDGLAANIDLVPTLLDVVGVKAPKDYALDGVSLKPAMFGDDAPVRDVLFSEMGHARAVKSKDWKYIAVRYPEKVQRRIERGGKFTNFDGMAPIERPYHTRNGHLGYNASLQNPHYFETDQLYSLQHDPAEDDNVFSQYPEVAGMMQKTMKAELAKFPNRPFGEFAGEQKKPRSSKVVLESGAVLRNSNDEAQMSSVKFKGADVWSSKVRNNAPTFFYFKVQDAKLRNGDFPMVDLEIEYLDAGNTEVRVEFDAQDHGFKLADQFWVGESGEWKTIRIELDHARFSGKCNGGDFRLGYLSPDQAPMIKSVSVKLVE